MKQRKMPLRKCTGCGEMKEKRELIRVVKAPDTKDENGEIIAKGEISLDLTGRKAGRGAYVCRNLACFEKARKARRFERSLSCKIPDEVYEQMQSELAAADSKQAKGFFMNDRILSLLGICKRAGKLITGADTTIDSIRKSKAKLVIFANDFSKSSKKSVQTAADECNVKTMDEMISLINRLENDPELYRTLQQKQRQVLHTYFFDAPLQSLINCL